MQANRPSVAPGKFNAAHNLAVGDRCIVRRQRVSPGYDDFFRNFNNPVCREAAVALEENHFAGQEFARIAPLYGDEIAGTDDWEHAGPGDFQLHLSVTARNLGDEIATR